MKRRIKTGIFISGALSAALLSGCGAGNQVVDYGKTQEEPVTITFFGNKYETENVIVIEEIITGFMKENPDVRVSYESLKGTEYYDALSKRMEAGKGDDIFMVNHDAVLELRDKGQLADLSAVSTLSNYTESMLSQMEDDGEIYWLPTTVSVFGLYCNMDLLKEHKQKIPENLGEWEDTCGYFLSRGIHQSLPIMISP